MTTPPQNDKVVMSEPARKHISEFFVGNDDLKDLNIYCLDQESAARTLAAIQSFDVSLEPIKF